MAIERTKKSRPAGATRASQPSRPPGDVVAPPSASSSRKQTGHGLHRPARAKATATVALEPERRGVPLALAIRESFMLKGPSAKLPAENEVQQLEAAGKHVVFSGHALDEAHALGDRSDQFATREHVQGVVFTIDKADTQDLDNALSIQHRDDGTVVVGIHATDVAAWLRVGGPLDFAARRRAATRYLVDEELALPMLPMSLTTDKLSLNEGEPRLTRSLELTYAADGTLIGSRLFRSQLINRHRLDAHEATEAAAGRGRATTAPEFGLALSAMRCIAGQASGASDPNAFKMTRALEYFSRQANLAVGRMLEEAGIETSYRNQPEPNTAATYDAEPRGHVSFEANAYTTWTGPMRRYADIDVQRAMDRLLDNRRPTGRTAELDTAMRSTQLERANGRTTDARLDIVDDVIPITRK